MTKPSTPFLAACRRQAVPYTPIWLMRQAGRFMHEYRAVRERHSMIEVITTPALAAEVTLQPVDAFGMDAAIIFADILPPLMGMGLHLEFVAGQGPRFDNPITSTYDVDILAVPPAEETVLKNTLDAIKLVVAELTPRGIPLIGFAGAPFTLASYAIEGGGSKNYAKVKSFMYSEPAAWKRLMQKLVTAQADYLLKQVQAGASALQVFDSWAGNALGQQDYNRYVKPYNTNLVERLQKAGVPVINFSAGTASYIADVAACGGDVIGVDWRMPLDWFWTRIGENKAIQGNLDPVALLAPWPELKTHIDDVLVRAAGRPGHVFNLGHGILPTTPRDNVRRLVDYVHEQTALRVKA